MVTGPALVEDLERCDEIVEAALANRPSFIARVGGSDTDLLIDMHRESPSLSRQERIERLAAAIDLVKRYNGFYDFSESIDNIFRFYEVMTSSFLSSNALFLVGASLLSEFLPNSIHETFRVKNGEREGAIRAFVSRKVVGNRHVWLLPYSYVERLTLGTTLFRRFSKALRGKRVLVMSPFSTSIEANFHNRFKFFKNYEYPEFSLLTYDTPITYPGLPRSFYPDRDWFETERRMESDITKLDFDIALLSCGSYAMPLGSYITKTLKRDAIYVGGCLQLYFGIIGRRYENQFFVDQLNREFFIRPIESKRYLAHAIVTPTMAAEAFGAYF